MFIRVHAETIVYFTPCINVWYSIWVQLQHANDIVFKDAIVVEFVSKM